MKKFIVKSATYLFIVTGIAFLVIYISILFKPAYFLGSPTDYFICTFQYNQISKKSDFRNIIIGDSRGNSSINPKIIGDNWINLSIPGSDFFEGYITLKRYSLKNKIDTLIMVYGLDYIAEKSVFFNIRTIPFGFPNPEELKELERIEKENMYLFHGIKTKNPGLLHINQITRKLKYLHFPYFYRSRFMFGFNNLMYSRSVLNSKKNKLQSQLEINRGYINFGDAYSNSHNSISRDTAFMPKPINLYYLNQIMKISEKEGITVILLIPPMNETSFKFYKNSTYENSVNQFLKTLETSQNKLTIMQKPAYLPDSMFGDSHHVNKRGTEFYSQTLKNILK